MSLESFLSSLKISPLAVIMSMSPLLKAMRFSVAYLKDGMEVKPFLAVIDEDFSSWLLKALHCPGLNFTSFICNI